jgi:hypothetical protein
MTTAVDTNVIFALWDRDKALSSAAQSGLDSALGRGSLVISAPVFTELMAAPARSESFQHLGNFRAVKSGDFSVDDDSG